ncbi:MAG TPA: DUF4124 domain-containing protein [Solimonas sp.]|nr:DUF4124 domain-containing protein [Solimonas sp.]
MNRRFLLSLLLALPLVAQAEIYRWTDAQGRAHFTQTPPPDAAYKKVDPRVSPANTADADSLRQKAEGFDKAREELAKQQAETEAKAQLRAGACMRAQQRARLMEENPPNRLSSINDKGEKERWTPEKYDAEKAKAQQAVEQNCDGSK